MSITSIREELTWHWLIVIGGFLAYVVADGCSLSVGVLYSEFLDAFEMSKSQTATIPGLLFGLPLLLGCIVSPLVESFGCSLCSAVAAILLTITFFVSSFSRTLTLISVMVALFAGIGLELAYVSALISVSKAFPPDSALQTHKVQRHHSLAMGLTVAGSGVGSVLFNPLIVALIDKFFWRNAMMIESSIFLHLFISAALFRQLNWRRFCLNQPQDTTNYMTSLSELPIIGLPQISSTSQSELPIIEMPLQHNEPNPITCTQSLITSLKGLVDRDLWTNPSFLLFTFAGALVGGAYVVPWSFTYDYGLTLGLLPTEAAFLLVIMGVTSTSGQVIFGALGGYVNPILLWSLIQTFGAICLFCKGLMTSVNGLYVLCGFVGLFYNMCLYPIILTNLVGEKLSYAALGLYLTCTGIFVLVTPPLAGYLSEYYGGYSAPFILSSIMVVIAALIGFALYLYKFCFIKARSFCPESFELK